MAVVVAFATDNRYVSTQAVVDQRDPCSGSAACRMPDVSSDFGTDKSFEPTNSTIGLTDITYPAAPAFAHQPGCSDACPFFADADRGSADANPAPDLAGALGADRWP